MNKFLMLTSTTNIGSDNNSKTYNYSDSQELISSVQKIHGIVMRAQRSTITLLVTFEHNLSSVEYILSSAEYGLIVVEYNLGTAEYGLIAVEYNLSTAEYGLIAVQYGLDTAEHSLDTAEHSLDNF